MNQIWGTIQDYIDLIEIGENGVEESEKKLALLLDKLALQMHDIGSEHEVDESDESLNIDYNEVAKMVKANFPNYGLYNVPLNVTVNVGEQEMGIGDAIDDITDIYIDFKQALFCMDVASEAEGLFYLQLMYHSHWGKHLRDLQSYIFNLEYEV